MTKKWAVVTSAVGVFALGFLVATLISDASAQNAGEWQCLVVDRLPDTKDAAAWRGAVKYTEGLNAIASHAPAGTVITGDYPSGGGQGYRQVAPVVCVKY